MATTYVYEIQDNIFLHSEQCDPKQSQDQQLDWTDFTQYCPVGNQAARHTEICIDQAEKKSQKEEDKWGNMFVICIGQIYVEI